MAMLTRRTFLAGLGAFAGSVITNYRPTHKPTTSTTNGGLGATTLGTAPLGA